MVEIEAGLCEGSWGERWGTPRVCVGTNQGLFKSVVVSVIYKMRLGACASFESSKDSCCEYWVSMLNERT